MKAIMLFPPNSMMMNIFINLSKMEGIDYKIIDVEVRKVPCEDLKKEIKRLEEIIGIEEAKTSKKYPDLPF